MWQQYAIGVAAVVMMTVAWVAVQGAWARVFPRGGCEPDVLAARGSCGAGCGCVPRRAYVDESEEAPATGREETS